MYKQYFHIQLLVGYREQYGFNIVHLELMAIVVGLKKWGPQFSGKRFGLYCDNTAVVEVINKGTAKDLRLQQLLRIFAFLCATGQFKVVAYHLMGSQNRVPDILSRMHLSPDYVKQFQEIKQPD